MNKYQFKTHLQQTNNVDFYDFKQLWQNLAPVTANSTKPKNGQKSIR